MNTSITHIPRRIDAALRSPWQMRAMAIVDAIILNTIILAVSTVVMDEYPVAAAGEDVQSIGFAPVLLVTLLAGLAAWGSLALLERITSRAKTIWTALAAAVFLVSLLGPFGSGEDTSSVVTLGLLHVGAAVTLIPLMRRSADA